MVHTSSKQTVLTNIFLDVFTFFHCNCRYSDETRASIAKYACQHGTKAASAVLSQKLGIAVSRLSIDSIKKAYRKRVQEAGSDEVSTLPPRKRGQPCLLGDAENRLKLYLSKNTRSRWWYHSISCCSCYSWHFYVL